MVDTDRQGVTGLYTCYIQFHCDIINSRGKFSKSFGATKSNTTCSVVLDIVAPNIGCICQMDRSAYVDLDIVAPAQITFFVVLDVIAAATLHKWRNGYCSKWGLRSKLWKQQWPCGIGHCCLQVLKWALGFKGSSGSLDSILSWCSRSLWLFWYQKLKIPKMWHWTLLPPALQF